MTTGRDPWVGMDELLADLEGFSRGVLPAVAPDALAVTAREVVSKAQQDTPRRTGRSARSISAGEVEVEGDSAQVEVGSDWFVMAIIEYGNARRAGLRPIGRAVEEQGAQFGQRLVQAMNRHAERYGL